MDLSALIFVALAVAWATYLIPKALRHHEDSSASRTVEGFSGRLRVLARREPVDGRSARLVVGDGKAKSKPAAEVELEVTLEKTAEPRPAARPSARPVPVALRRAAARRAAQRRLRVVLTILLAGVGVGIAAAVGAVGPVWLVAPAVVLVAWLVLCRVMVRRERAVAVPSRRLPVVAPTEAEPAVDEDPLTEEIVAVHVELPAEDEDEAPVDETPEPEPTPEAPAAPTGWDPVPTTLPTYVGKEQAARRSVRTIDLDATGVWTSGPLASDSALAREAEAERATRTSQAKDEQDKKRRA